MKRIVVTTSTSCLDYIEHNETIETIRIKVDIDGKLYDDGTELRAEKFYDMLVQNSNLIPKTSQPSIGQLLEQFEDLADKGYDELFVTTISSKFSGTYNAIRQCASMLEDKIKVVVYDTYTVNYNEGLFALTAAKMIRENKTDEEIIAALDKIKANNTILFAVDELDYLVKNGRLSGAAGFIGKTLKIKPLLQVCDDGTIKAIEKIRTSKKALIAVCDRVAAYTAGHKFSCVITFTGDKLKPYFIDLLKEKLGLENVMESPCTPIVGCHVGPNAIGLSVFLED